MKHGVVLIMRGCLHKPPPLFFGQKANQQHLVTLLFHFLNPMVFFFFFDDLKAISVATRSRNED
jgi:hypothetical protein